MPDIVTRVEGLEAAVYGQSQVSATNNTNTSLLTQRVQNIEVALFELGRAAERISALLEVEGHEDLEIKDDALKQLEGVL